jgi:hypothetical protein
MFVDADAGKAKNLDADKLDGKDSSEFVQKSDQRVFAFGQIREDASIRNSSPNVTSVEHPGTGEYCINFSSPPAQVEVEGSVVGLAGGGSAALFARVTNGQASGFSCTDSSALSVSIYDGAGTRTNGRFSFLVP